MKYTEDGKEYDFFHERFKYYFDQHRGKKDSHSKSRKDVQEEIAAYVNVSFETVKNWLRNGKGKSAPNDVGIVHKLEQFFDVEPGYFLKGVHMEEVYIKNRQGIPDSEMSAAREVYCAILDCIHAHMIPWGDWFSWPDMGTPDFHPKRGLSKDRFHLILKIRKSATDIPERVRLASIDLVNEIYGPEDTSDYAFFETSEFYAYMHEHHPGWHEEMKEWAEEFGVEYKGPNSHCVYDNGEYLEDMVEYNEYMTEKFYRRLDEIFADYIRH